MPEPAQKSNKKKVIQDIVKIEFGLLSAEEIRKMAVCRVENAENSGKGSVYDKAMGDVNETCVTCGFKRECWGHFGYIDLVDPVLHPMYYKQIVMLLRCFCKNCSRLLITKDQMKLTGIDKLKPTRRFAKLADKLKKVEVCVHCNDPQPNITFKQTEMIISKEYTQKRDKDVTGATKKGEKAKAKKDIESEDKSEHAHGLKVLKKKQKPKKPEKISIPFTVEEIQKIFNAIKEEDLPLIGLNPRLSQPKDLVVTVLPVIPPCSRPYVISEGSICHDDLTYQLQEILKINIQLQKIDSGEKKFPNEEKKQQARDKLSQSLRFRYSTMINNSKAKAKHPTDNRALKGIKERLAGKQGRLRTNIMGKRVDFSARTVAGPGPHLKSTQLAVPYEVAKIHTKPEVVNRYNKEWLEEIVNRGEANFIVTNRINPTTGEVTKLRINLQYGLYTRGTELYYKDLIIRKPSLASKLEKKKGADGKIPEKYINRLVEKALKEKMTKRKKDVIIVERIDEPLFDGNIILRDGIFIQAKPCTRKKYTLNIGDTVERQLQDGDIINLGRQPSLHKGSMMGFEIIRSKHKTFRTQLSVTRSFNLDYDDIAFVINRKHEKCATS